MTNPSGDQMTYNVAVSGMTGSGTVIASVAAGRGPRCGRQCQHGLHQHRQHGDLRHDVRPTVTINQAAGQADPTNASPINFTVVFSEPVTDFATGDVTLGGTAPGTLVGTVTSPSGDQIPTTWPSAA